MHNIENENNTLEKLLIRIKDTNARKQDFIAPTKELQFRNYSGRMTHTKRNCYRG